MDIAAIDAVDRERDVLHRTLIRLTAEILVAARAQELEEIPVPPWLAREIETAPPTTISITGISLLELRERVAQSRELRAVPLVRRVQG